MIHLVVTCVGSKITGPGCSILDAVKNIDTGPIGVRHLYNKWKSALTSQLQANLELKSATEIYKGATWRAAIDAYNEIEGPKRRWIVSCGFGLINEDDLICKYAATFKAGELDSIYKRGRFDYGSAEESKSEWWQALIEDPPLGTNRIHSLHGLVNNCENDDTVILAAGADYLRPLTADLNLIKEPISRLYLIGYRRKGNILEPRPPVHLSNCAVSFRDGRKYRQFLADNLGKCSATQVQNKAAQFLIRQLRTQDLAHIAFP